VLDVLTTGKFIPLDIWTGVAVAKDTVPQKTNGIDTEDMDAVADRLEAALERIARSLDAAKPAAPSAEVVARLDRLIGRLRDVLGGSQDPSQD
jgi:hypothetical protein